MFTPQSLVLRFHASHHQAELFWGSVFTSNHSCNVSFKVSLVMITPIYNFSKLNHSWSSTVFGQGKRVTATT